MAWTDSRLFRRPGSPEGASWEKSTRLSPREKERERERESRGCTIYEGPLCASRAATPAPMYRPLPPSTSGHGDMRNIGPHIGTEECPPGSGRRALRLTPRKTGANEGTNFFELSRDFDVNEQRSTFPLASIGTFLLLARAHQG